MKNLFYFFVFTFILAGCKSNINEHKDYIGNWKADLGDVSYSFNVYPEGDAEYFEVKSSGFSNKLNLLKGNLFSKVQNLSLELKVLILSLLLQEIQWGFGC